MSLPIGNVASDSVEQGLSRYFQPDSLDSGNPYDCAECDKKAKGTT
jgi:hypothetical protein